MEPIDQSEPVDENVIPVIIFTGGEGDMGGPDVAQVEELMGHVTTSDDYNNSGGTEVEHLSTDSTYNPQDYTEFYTS